MVDREPYKSFVLVAFASVSVAAYMHIPRPGTGPTSRVLGVPAAQRSGLASLAQPSEHVLSLFVGMLVTSPGQPRYDLDHGDSCGGWEV
jgi:hypothetical protein